MSDVLKDRNVTIARELTKLNEEYIEGSLNELKDLDFKTIIGEIVLIIEGNKDENNKVDDQKILERANYLLSRNISVKDVSDIISYELNIPKKYVYNLLINQK